MSILLIVIFVLSPLRKNEIVSNFVTSFAAVAKAIVSEGLDEDAFMVTDFKLTKHLQLITLSLFGGFLFWFYTGVLISTLTVPSTETPLKNLGDLPSLGGNFKLVVHANSITESFVRNWANESPRNKKAHDEKVVYVQSMAEYIKEQKNGIGNLLFFETAAYFSDIIKQGKK